MKNLRLLILLGTFVLTLSTSVLAQNPNCEVFPGTSTKTGKINGVFHTSCFDWVSTDGTLTVNSVSKHNDTRRLNAAIVAAVGKLVFDEGAYHINDSLAVYPFRTLVGTGRSTLSDPTNAYYSYYSSLSRIVQTANNKPIFLIGADVESVAIRDLGLTSSTGTTGAIGIKAENGTTEPTSGQSLNFEFSNLTFTNLDKGIYANAQYYPSNQGTGYGAEGFWRFDNVTLENSKFENCRIGVHVNSNNSGWSLRNLHFAMAGGPQIPLPAYNAQTQQYSGGIDSTNAGSVTVAMYLQRIGYSTIDLAIGDGPHSSTGLSASAFVYVGQHGNLNIQSSIDEGFKNSIYIFGGDINYPVNISNNIIQSTMVARNTTVVSTANQFTNFSTTNIAPAKAMLGSKVYSIGDRYCLDYVAGNSYCQEPINSNGINTATYELDAYSRMMFSSNSYTTTVESLRFGSLNYQYDIFRDGTSGILTFNGVQTGGYAGYKFQTPNGVVKIQNDGSVTYASKTYTNLISGANLDPYLYSDAPDGTVIYCSDCQKTTPCSSGGTGAIAKRLNNAWDCD